MWHTNTEIHIRVFPNEPKFQKVKLYKLWRPPQKIYGYIDESDPSRFREFIRKQEQAININLFLHIVSNKV